MTVTLTPRAEPVLMGATVGIEHDLRHEISELVDSLGTKKAAAEKLGISQAYLGDILMGRRGVGEQLAGRLGWKRVPVFVQIEVRGEGK